MASPIDNLTQDQPQPGYSGGRHYADLKPGDVLRHRFELQALLGEGGMSKVFLAQDVRRVEAGDRNPNVAIKVLRQEIAGLIDSLPILQREASRMQQLAHPNIATVYDFDRDGDIAYLVMEYVEGKELSAFLCEHPIGVPLRTAASIIAGMAAGLSYAHSKGVVHLDFKPSNVIILPDGGVKIFDFGLSRAFSGHGGPLSGYTPRYASLELFTGEPADVRDDIYSFSLTVYELLSGQHPFYGKASPNAVDEALVPKALPDLSKRQWRALRKGLQLHRRDRAATVMEVAQPLLAPLTYLPFGFLDRTAATLMALIHRLVSRLMPTPTTMSVPKKDSPGRTWVADQPIATPVDDCLGYIDYAKALFGVIDHPKTQPPLTIAVNGAFGIGKSSVALLTEHLLAHKLEDDGEKPHITAWMRVGKYRGAPSLRASFVRDFVRDLYYSQSFWFRLRSHLPTAFLLPAEARRKRLWYMALLIAVGAAGFVIAQGHGIEKVAGVVDYASAVGLLSSSALAFGLWLSSTLGSLRSLADYVNPDDDSANATHHGDAGRQIAKMVGKITGDKRRFVLFIDDLERQPERTLEVLDIIESLFCTPNCMIVIPTDLDLLSEALERHANIRNGRRYLEKYIQLQFDMPSVENNRLLDLLSRQHSEGSEAEPQVVSPQPIPAGYETIANARSRIDRHIRDQGVTGPIMNSVLLLNATRWNYLVDERKQRALPETEIYKRALHLAVALAGRDIRAAKRISNHVRLYIFVLFQRGLLHSNSTLTPEHVGRWIALKELWPEISSAVNRSPGLFSVLVRWAGEPPEEPPSVSLARVAAENGSLGASDVTRIMSAWDAARIDPLRNFLRAEPRLDTVVQELCYLRRSA